MGIKSKTSKTENLLKIFEAKQGGFLLDDTPRGLLEMLVIGGGLVAGLTFAPTLLFALAGVGFAMKAEDRRERKKIHSSFQYLKRHQYVRVVTKNEGTGVRIEVTEKGRMHAEKIRIRRALLRPIARPKQWDKRWRIIMFDIATNERSKRSAFRGLIRRLGAVMLQKSVWIYPFDCSSQVELLKNMLELGDAELRLIVADSIGIDAAFRKHFKLG